MRQHKQQTGLSMLGFLFIAALVVAAVMLGFRVTPSYVEYYSVQKALEQALAETKDLNSTPEIRAAFQRRADAGYIESVSGRDIEVTRTRNQVTASASWTRKLALFGNASLLLEFDAAATR